MGGTKFLEIKVNPNNYIILLNIFYIKRDIDI